MVTKQIVLKCFCQLILSIFYVPKKQSAITKSLEQLCSKEHGFKNIKLKSLILAQDERWRRA